MFKSKLLKSNLSAFSLKLLLDLVSLFLRSTFLKNLRSAINNVLSFLKSKTCTVTNNLDNLNLVRTYFCKLYVEGILLLSCASTVCTCCCNYNACCCGYAELFLTCFYKIV